MRQVSPDFLRARHELMISVRLWSLNPTYLDSQGLNAVWREGLLAQSVLGGKTKGWKYHPQLDRFKNTQNPMLTIGYYLLKVFEESQRRTYHYDYSKIMMPVNTVHKIPVTAGQLEYEYKILKARIKTRSPSKYHALIQIERSDQHPEPHPLFVVVKGEVEYWEKTYWKKYLQYNSKQLEQRHHKQTSRARI